MTAESFDNVIKVLPEPSLIATSEGKVVAANEALGELLNCSPKALTGRSLAKLVEEPAEKVKSYLASCARTSELVPGVLTWQQLNGQANRMQSRFEGSVLRPWSPQAPALLFLRQKPHASSSSRFTLLNEKIDELAKEIRVRRKVERRLTFLVRASMVLSRSLDYEETLQRLAELTVAELADWCAITMFDPEAPANDTFQQVAVAHRDPEKVEWARDLRRRYPPNPWDSYGSPHVIRSGEPELYQEISDEMLVETAEDAEHLKLLRSVGMRSAIIVPMQAHDTRLGAITMIRTKTSNRFTEDDLEFAKELARRAALQVANARLYRDAERSRARAEEMNRLKSAFLANMSHEIRTPLTGIIGMASLLGRKSPDHSEYVQRIESSGQRLLETLNAVLTLAQLEAQNDSLELKPLTVADEVPEAVELMRQQAEEKGLLLKCEIDPAAAHLQARLDRGALMSILQNLIGNAVKYTESGEIMVTVTKENQHVRVDVEDTGVGIEEQHLEHIFESFWQESKGWSRSHEGSGIGLSIAKRMVEYMDGEITARSTKGQGSRFTIRFPIIASAADVGSSSAPSTTDESKDTPSNRPLRILVVEDNSDTRFFMRTLLEEVGQVHEAVDAEQALNEIQRLRETDSVSDTEQAPFDVFVIDINLGAGKNGVDLLKELREDPSMKNAPMAAVTAYAMPGDRERLLSEGFDAYLDKPFRADDLLDLINNLLDR